MESFRQQAAAKWVPDPSRFVGRVGIFRPAFDLVFAMNRAFAVAVDFAVSPISNLKLPLPSQFVPAQMTNMEAHVSRWGNTDSAS
jgi:hypothetical protein